MFIPSIASRRRDASHMKFGDVRNCSPHGLSLLLCTLALKSELQFTNTNHTCQRNYFGTTQRGQGDPWRPVHASDWMHHLALPGRYGCISTGQEVHVLLGSGSSLAETVLACYMWNYVDICDYNIDYIYIIYLCIIIYIYIYMYMYMYLYQT